MMLDVLTYRDHDFDDAVISPPSLLFHIQNPRKGTVSIGGLDKFPLELLHEVLLLLDLQSVTSFRTANSKSMEIVDSLRQYNQLATLVPGALRALIATQAACHFTVSLLFDTLCTATCSTCDKFGGFLFLPQCTRCCIRCLTLAPEFMPMSVPEAKRIFKLSAAEISNRVPVVHTVPGSYSLEDRERTRRIKLVCPRRAEDAAVNKSAHNPQLIAWRMKLQASDGCGDQTTGPNHIYRFMCATPFPYFDRDTRTAHCGLYCTGCKIGLEREYEITVTTEQKAAWRERREAMYSEVGFLKHYEECRYAQKVWETRDGSQEWRKPHRY